MTLLDFICVAALISLSVVAWKLYEQVCWAKRKALENQESFQQLFEDVPLACMEVDLDGIIRRVNQKLCELRGLPAVEMLGKHYAELAAENERDRVRCDLRRKLAGDEPLEP